MAVRKRRYNGKQDEPTEAEGENPRPPVQRVMSDQRNQPKNDSEAAASDISSVLERATAFTLEEIDNLISDLATSRDALNSEAARVQREVVQYSMLSQAALQSTKIISESLMQFRKPVEAPGQ
jgi:chemotaxis protein histidine kinase CheA